MFYNVSRRDTFLKNNHRDISSNYEQSKKCNDIYAAVDQRSKLSGKNERYEERRTDQQREIKPRNLNLRCCGVTNISPPSCTYVINGFR